MTGGDYRTAWDLCDRRGRRAGFANRAAPLRGKRRYGRSPPPGLEDLKLGTPGAAEPGFHRVLVVDGGASLRAPCLASICGAGNKSTTGRVIVVNGAVRHVATRSKRWTSHHGRSPHAAVSSRRERGGDGNTPVPVAFAGVVFPPQRVAVCR